MTKKSTLQRRISALSLLAAIIISPLVGNAAIDKKYFKKMADKVWSMDLPQFDPKADLSDSLFRNKSAVIIAKYTNLTAKHEKSANEQKYRLTGLPEDNAINCFYIQRTMIKLNDATSVEKYGEFEIDPARKETIRGFTLFTEKNAFGARIFKPDGSVRNVDLKEVLTVKEGKKDKKEKSYKLAVPGLETGDILDFFYTTEIFADEQSLKGVDFGLLGHYPAKDFKIECNFSPTLAFEYGIYNGAPDFERHGKMSDGLIHCSIHLTNVEAIEEKYPYFQAARQMPYISMNILNNTARLEFVPKNPRQPGLRKMTYPYLVQDACMLITATKLPEKLESTALSIASDWINVHPQATDREKSDATWMAVRYAAEINDNECNSRHCCVAFCNITEKLNFPIPGRIAISTPRHKLPVTQLASYRDANYLAICGDAIYFPGYEDVMSPGETPIDFCGEEYVKFNANPLFKQLPNYAERTRIPASNAKDNKTSIETSMKINPDNPELTNVATSGTCTGTAKSTAILFTDDNQLLTEYERYLGLKSKKKKASNKKNDTEQKEEFESFAKRLWGSEESTLENYKVDAIGITPDSKEWRFSLQGSVPGLVSEAGNGLMVKVGQMIGKQVEVSGSTRNRSVSVVRESASHNIYKIRLEIPEGYQVATESLENLKRNITTQEGQFYVNATLEDNSVLIDVSERYTHAIAPATAWPSILKIIDAAYDFQNASLVLKPV